MTEQSELERVVAALECDAAMNREIPVKTHLHETAKIESEAARLLREMAADFEEYADHGLNDRGENCERAELGGRCGCGLSAARERWRLTK